MPPPPAPDPRLLGDFFVSGNVTLGALGEIYGLDIAAEQAATTIADFFAGKVGHRVHQGDVLPLGAIALVANTIADGRVTSAGLRLADPEPFVPIPNTPLRRLRRWALRGFAWARRRLRLRR